MQISQQIRGYYGYIISKWLVWPLKIKRARRKTIKGILTNSAIFGRAGKNFDFAVIFYINIIRHVSQQIIGRHRVLFT